MILIITNKNDVHADEVIRRLGTRNVPVFRLNTEDILTKYLTSLTIDQFGSWQGSITDELSRTVYLSDLRVAWVRRPEFSFEEASNGIQKFIASEVKALVNCIYSIPGIEFINEVFRSNRAKNKFQQLIAASRYGIRVPRTIITNDPVAARSFVSQSCGDLLVKSVFTGNVERFGVSQALPSRKIVCGQLLDLCDLVQNAPTQIQDYIEKKYELRITVIGSKVFAVKIDSQLNESTKVDWRPHTALNPHSIIEIPSTITQFCSKFIEGQGLVYGAMDFIVDPNGQYVFLENNPSGQYLWLEQMAGVEITEALIDLFVELSCKK